MAQILPETLGKLSNLRRLVLDRNMLRGSIPIDFGHLSQLGTIFITLLIGEFVLGLEFLLLSPPHSVNRNTLRLLKRIEWYDSIRVGKSFESHESAIGS